VIVFMLSSITRKEWQSVAVVLVVASVLFAFSRMFGNRERVALLPEGERAR
jgi:uncharacterized membrane protein YvbJ